MMIINELADHLITMALITQLNANCPRREWSLLRPPLSLPKVTMKGQEQQSIGGNRQKWQKEEGSEEKKRKPVEQRFSLLNDAQNVSILILHAILV